MEKNFIFSDELKWNWHRSWNIPTIKCDLKVIKKFKMQIY